MGGGKKKDNLHILQPKNKENHKPIQEYPLRVPIPYNNSQNQNWPVILRNRTRAASINLRVMHANVIYWTTLRSDIPSVLIKSQ